MKHEPAPKNLLFESLRGLAALAVFLFHLSPVYPQGLFHAVAKYGWVGVNLFFALSGFLIARSVLTPSRFQFSSYVRSRARRILPAYLASLVILISVQNTRYLVAPGWQQDLGAHLVLLHAWFGGGIISSINGVYWTLSHEWTFYLLMGLAAPLLRGTRCGWPVVVTLIAVSLVARWGWITGRWEWPSGHHYPLCVWDQFAFGVLAAGLCQHWQHSGRTPGKAQLMVLVILGTAMAAWGLYRYQLRFEPLRDAARELDSLEEVSKAFGKKPAIFMTTNLLISLGFGCLLLVGWLRGDRLTPFLKFTPLPWMGKVSYSTYIWHLPVVLCLTNLKRRASTTPGLERWLDDPAAFMAAALVLGYLLSWISYRGFERPFLREKPAGAS